MIFKQFSRIWRIETIYNADKMEERAESWPTPMLMLEKENEKLFQKYWVFLPTR